MAKREFTEWRLRNCYGCREEKNVYKNGYCKQCVRKASKKNYLKNPERSKEISRKGYLQNKDISKR